MPLGAFRLNGLARYIVPEGPIGTGWGAYTGSQDGNIFTLNDTTYGAFPVGADLITPNAVLVSYGGTANGPNNCRIGRFTWDANNNLTHTLISSINRQNQRSPANYLTGQAFGPSVRRLTADPSQNGYVIIVNMSEGGTSGFADVHYALYSINASTNALTQLANTRVRPGGGMGFLTPNVVPTYGRVSSGVGRFNIVAGGAGGSNSVNILHSMTYNQSTGAIINYNEVGIVTGSRADDGARHPINSVTNIVNGNADPMMVTFGNGLPANNFRPVRFYGSAFNPALSDNSTDQWSPGTTSRARIFPDKHHISRPGQQLYQWGQETVDGIIYQRMFYGKTRYVSESAPARFFPSSSYVDAAVYDATYTTFVDYCTCLPSTTEGVAFYAVRNSGNTGFKIKMVAYDINPEFNNNDAPSITPNGSVMDVTGGEITGTLGQIKCVDIDSNRILVTWSQDNNKLRAKIVRKV